MEVHDPDDGTRLARPDELLGLLRHDLDSMRLDLQALDGRVQSLRQHHQDDLNDVADRFDKLAEERAELLADIHARLGHAVERMDQMQKTVDEIANTYMLMLAGGGLLIAVMLFIGERALEGGPLLP